MENQEAPKPKNPLTKTEFINALSEAAGLTKQQVAGLFEQLANLIEKNLGQDGPGVLTIPGLMKLKAVRKPATEARKGINPFTKEDIIIKAKPARNVVKITPLKGLKDRV